MREIAGAALFPVRVDVTNYPLQAPAFPSIPLRHVSVCHHTAIAVFTKLHH